MLKVLSEKKGGGQQTEECAGTRVHRSERTFCSFTRWVVFESMFLKQIRKWRWEIGVDDVGAWECFAFSTRLKRAEGKICLSIFLCNSFACADHLRCQMMPRRRVSLPSWQTECSQLMCKWTRRCCFPLWDWSCKVACAWINLLELLVSTDYILLKKCPEIQHQHLKLY